MSFSGLAYQAPLPLRSKYSASPEAAIDLLTQVIVICTHLNMRGGVGGAVGVGAVVVVVVGGGGGGGGNLGVAVAVGAPVLGGD